MFKLRSLFVVLIIAVAVFTFQELKTPNYKTAEKIQFATWGSKSEISILKPILADFRKQNPDIDVELVHIPQNYFQKLHLLFASNLAPDVIFLNNLYLPIYAKAGLLEELVPAKGVFFEKSIESLSYQGKNYAVPRDVSNLVIYYNKDIFDKYKVPYPTSDWTFADFLNTAKALTKDTNKDGKIDLWGISFEEDLFFYLPYLMSEGGGVLSDDLKKVIIDEAQSQKGLNFYSDLRNKYHVAPTQAQSASATMAQMFLQKQLSMHLSGRWLVPKYREDATFNWDVINFPKGDNGSIVPLDASGWAVSKSSKHKKQAERLIQFLSSKESIEKFAKSGLITPARLDVARSDAFLDNSKKPQNSKVFVEVIQTSKPTPVSVNYREITDEIKQKTSYLFNKQK